MSDLMPEPGAPGSLEDRIEIVQDVIDRLLSNENYREKLVELNKENPAEVDYNRRLHNSREAGVGVQNIEPLQDHRSLITNLCSNCEKNPEQPNHACAHQLQRRERGKTVIEPDCNCCPECERNCGHRPVRE